MFLNDEIMGEAIITILEMWSDTKKARKDYDRAHKNNDEKNRGRKITITISEDEY